MQKPLHGEYAPGYQKYFDLVGDGNYIELLRQNSAEAVAFFERLPDEKLDYKYDPDKWTIKEVVTHLIDTERVFAYRGLVAARGDNVTPIYRMDEELYAAGVDVSNRTQESLVREFTAVRSSTETLFENVTDAQSRLACSSGNYPMTARAIGYFMIGHIEHHLNVIRERYL